MNRRIGQIICFRYFVYHERKYFNKLSVYSFNRLKTMFSFAFSYSQNGRLFLYIISLHLFGRKHIKQKVQRHMLNPAPSCPVPYHGTQSHVSFWYKKTTVKNIFHIEYERYEKSHEKKSYKL